MAGSELLTPSPATRISALLLLASLTLLWVWWALVNGAFFATVMLPGSILLLASVGIVLAYAPLPLANRGPHVLAVGGLTALATWSAISIAWTPARDTALEFAQRGFVYAAAFGAGLLLAMTLRRNLLRALIPLLAAGAVAAVMVVVRTVLSDDATGLLDAEGTLTYPFGYRNANAGFFVVVGLVTATLLARPRSGLAVRAACAGLGALAFSLAAISQSRGSMLGLAAGALVLVAAHPRPFRAILALGVALIPMALLLPELLGPYQAASDARPVVEELRTACWAAAVSGIVAGLLGALWSIVERRGGGAINVPLPSARVGIGLACVLALMGAAATVALAGNPLEWFDDPGTSVTAEEEADTSRLTAGGSTNRRDFWRVALEQASDSPVWGGGAGSFRSTYLRERDSFEQPRDAHSLPLEQLGELGAVGLLLLIVGFAGMLGGALRSRRLGPEAAVLSAAALTAVAAFGAQACVDWSWSFAGLTAPVLALLGSAGATAALSLTPLSRNVRRAGIGLAAALAVLAIPTFASDRLTLDAALGWRNDPDGADVALDRATALNPLNDLPLLVRAEIARQNDEPEAALEALQDARERQAVEFDNYLLAAEILVDLDPEQAAANVERALELNPLSRQALDLQAELEE